MFKHKFVLIALSYLLFGVACAPAKSSAPVDQTALDQESALETLAAAQTPLDESKPLIVLVPGFFNSIAPSHPTSDEGWVPYFSAAVLNTIRRQGLTAVRPDLMAPIGTIEQNGELLSRFLAATMDRFPGRRMIVVAHSAGGLYTLYALNQRPNLPIDSVITIATPYEGVSWIEGLSTRVPGFDALMRFLKIDGLRQFRPALVQKALKTLRVPESVRWIAIGGTQPGCLLWTCAESRNLSWVLTIAQNLMRESSDGIVPLSSALGSNTRLVKASGREFDMERWADFSFDLDHWEMVEEAGYFSVLGVTDIPQIRSEQKRYWNEILRRLMLKPVPTSP